MSGATHTVRSRVIVAVGPAAPDPLLLAVAARLARSGDAELATLFVEDINLLRLAELPFAIEIGMASSTMRRLGVSDIERALKRQAAELRGVLAEITAAAQLDWTFEMVRGRPARVLLQAAGKGDLVVLTGAAVRTLAHTALTGAMRSALAGILPGARPRRAQPVAAALHPGPGALRVLAAAHRLAQANAADLLLLHARGGAQEKELLLLAEDWLGERGAAARLMPVRDLAPASIAQALAGARLEALFWPGDGVQEIESEVEALTAAIGCPLIVVH
ncbi:MAG: hypothetical protein ACK4N4_13735 [Burkholderiales bacterium]